MKAKKSNNFLLDADTGFNTRVNLYIIRHLYFKMKKSEYFMIENPENNSKRKKSEDIKSVIGIPRQRLYKIYRGENFSMAPETSGHLATMFNISQEYFKKNGGLIEIHGITQEDWKCFFSEKYVGSVKNLNRIKGVIKDKAKEVQSALDHIIDDDYLIGHYDKDTALYHIYYYFKEHDTYKTLTRLGSFLKDLEDLKISDWEELIHDPEQLKECHQILQKHFEYISAHIKIHELQNK